MKREINKRGKSMKVRKIPMRTCIACKECKPKKDLIRIVKTDLGFQLDKTGKLNGRGAYICKNIKSTIQKH